MDDKTLKQLKVSTTTDFNHEQSIDNSIIDPVNIEEDLITNSSWMNFYGSQAARWEAQSDRFKMQLNAKAGEITTRLKSSGEKGMTDKYIDGSVKSDPEYIKLLSQHIDAEETAKLYKNAWYSLDKKQFSLQALNSRQKSEENYTKSSSVQSNLSEEQRQERRNAILDAQR